MHADDEIRLVLSKRQLKAALLVALVSGGACLLYSERLTLSTYYPAPSGVYNQMVTTGRTWLARDPGGFVAVGAAASPAAGTALVVMGGNVGVGMTAPEASLSVAGGVQLGDDSPGNSACPAAKAGTLRWDSSQLQVCNGSSWVSAMAAGAQPGVAGGACVASTSKTRYHCGPENGFCAYYSIANTPIAPVASCSPTTTACAGPSYCPGTGAATGAPTSCVSGWSLVGGAYCVKQ